MTNSNAALQRSNATGEAAESLRPRSVSPSEWRAMSPKERASRAMFEKTEEWDFRGGLSSMTPIAIPQEDLTIVARVMLSLSAHEFERLARIGRQAAGEA